MEILETRRKSNAGYTLCANHNEKGNCEKFGGKMANNE